jgi:peptidoglycan-N-acetylglucosamine deacetylase
MGHARSVRRRTRPIATSRKILCTAVAVAGSLAAAGSLPASAAGAPPQPSRAALSQAGRRLILTVRTVKPVALAKLDRVRGGDASYLCFDLRGGGQKGERQLCLGGARNASRRAGLLLLNAAGKVTDRREVAARLKRPEPDKLVLALLPADAGLAPRRYRWRVLAGQAHCRTRAPAACETDLPAHGSSRFRLRPVRPVGCTGGSAGLLTNGLRDRRVLALTFDDGPSEYTPAFLDVLRQKHVDGTFFEIGQEMPGREQTMRRILSEGSEIGNHTMHHAEYPGYSEIAGASALIESSTHFKPCLFRPPGGAVNSGVIATAGSLGMRTINWDVDPRDWSTPGTSSIYNTIVGQARPGSIILMHDGGGPRGETLAALPHVIDTLRSRGYGFETVSELLGHRLIYKPFG